MTDPSVLVKDGRLANVWVRVAGASDAPPPPEPVRLDQQDCMYLPRVAAAVVGQGVVARNGDPVLHNVHVFLGPATLFNRAMPNQAAVPLQAIATEPGLMKWKCDVHPWMRAFVGVSRNGLQAVTPEAGTFRIGNVPPGTWSLEAWHEKYGVKSRQVTIAQGQGARAVFSYDGTERP